MKKKLLILGGIASDIPLIKSAKDGGCHVITCNFLPDADGHRLADECFNVSTTDREKVLELARSLKIDGIITYASDVSTATVAYVASELGLPGNPLESVDILTHKDLFRKFLTQHGFKCPVAGGYSRYEDALADISRYRFPVMVKPVDASGSKGVVKVQDLGGLYPAVKEALAYSRCGRFVVEEFIVKKGYQVSGDGFSIDGKFVFSSYGNELYSGKGIRDYVALGEFWPSLLSLEMKDRVDAEIQRLITALGMRTSAYNIEVIIDEHDDVYILELGPRNGGSYIPQLIRYATGVDLIEPTWRAALGETLPPLAMAPTIGVYSNYMIYSVVSGRFREIAFDPVFKAKNLLEVHCTARVGDEVRAYRNSTDSLGTILFKADSVDEMRKMTAEIERFYKVVIE